MIVAALRIVNIFDTRQPTLLVGFHCISPAASQSCLDPASPISSLVLVVSRVFDPPTESSSHPCLQIRFRPGLPFGDGVLFYPGQAFSPEITEPVASCRLERFLSGMQVNFSSVFCCRRTFVSSSERAASRLPAVTFLLDGPKLVLASIKGLLPASEMERTVLKRGWLFPFASFRACFKGA